VENVIDDGARVRFALSADLTSFTRDLELVGPTRMVGAERALESGRRRRDQLRPRR
jgi:hypothetical protein